jgi:hypothetical protein
MKTPAKKTAGNTPALARIKERMNGPIYNATAKAYNEGGEAAAREVLGRHFWHETRQATLDTFFTS